MKCKGSEKDKMEFLNISISAYLQRGGFFAVNTLKSFFSFMTKTVAVNSSLK